MMSDNPVIYEVFEEDPPSHISSYIMSGFVLAGLMGLAIHVPFWPLSMAHVVVAIWFGILFVWILRDARQQKRFSSHRLTATSSTFKHSFRYAVAEATHVEIAVSDIVEIRVSQMEPRWIEVNGKTDSDIYFLPAEADLEQLIAVLKAGNPAIRVAE